MHNKSVHIAVFLAAVAGLFFFVTQSYFSGETRASNKDASTVKEDLVEDVVAPTTRNEVLTIGDNDTFGILLETAGVSGTDSVNIYNASVEVYDLARIRVGREITLTYDLVGDTLQQLMYPIDTEEELFVTRQEDNTWLAERIPINYDIVVKTAGGIIETSMYEAALEAGIDERAIIDLANVFQWSVDFALDVRTGDKFAFTYEERYRNGEYMMPGKVIAGTFINEDYTHYAFYFPDSDDNTGYFDENANSVQKMFLKAPVAFKYISSGFTTGRRFVQAFNTSTGHRAIDYAAASGTPIRSVGDGKVARAGWNGPFGNFVSVRHNGTYTTNYAHMSRIAVKYGQQVKQGQIIGYVGSTGFSTGPHLHYEMVKHGVKINPLREVLPPGEPISGENKTKFEEATKPLKEKLDQLISEI